MTHDELLAKLWILPVDITETQHGARAVQALRAVVELHKPMEENCECNREHVPTCEECVDDYPCSTIQTIEKELE